MRSKGGQSVKRSLTIPRITTLTRGSWSKLYALSIRKAATSDESVTSKCAVSEKKQEKDESATSSNISDQLNAMVKEDNTAAPDVDVDVEIAQMVGILKKKSHLIGPQLWNKRFFLLKDGYLFYYPVVEKHKFKRNKRLNLHPKGILSLERCQVDLCGDDGEVHCISINRDDFLQPVLLACNGESNQQRWLAALREACFVSTSNYRKQSEKLKMLEENLVKVKKEKQHFMDLLNVEVMAVRAESEKSKALLSQSDSLEQEKCKLEKIIAQLRDELIQVREELSKNYEETHQLLEEKFHISIKSQKVEAQNKEMRNQKQLLEESIRIKVSENDALVEEISRLTIRKGELENDLKRANWTINQLQNAKIDLETKLKKLSESKDRLENERRYFVGQTRKMVVGVDTLTRENSFLSQELQERHGQWLRAEKHLREAQNAWCRIERKLTWDRSQLTAKLVQETLRDAQIISNYFSEQMETAQSSRLDENCNRVSSSDHHKQNIIIHGRPREKAKSFICND
ncbi:Pleckstrin homology domain-containing family D member 1 [Trichinella spiralis]|uniref:Pleckstrin homology domain-containing family D member 1 n=2 Tax=Trichinella spiralis TaxID=6334 RepID=A0A0V1BQ60_TRISP|nr:Pleckstrin homology domain-containing family D member 1 [Trichinella spiralis]